MLQDAFEFADDSNNEENDEEESYSFPVLAQSDDETENDSKPGYKYDADEMGLSDVDEANYLLSHDGMLDTSADGRKNAKKRTQEMKKQATAKKKDAVQKQAPSKKSKTPISTAKKHTADENTDKKSDKKTEKTVSYEIKDKKKEQKDLERKRKKRSRDYEKYFKGEAKKKGKRKHPYAEEEESDDISLARNKRARATAVVNAYLLRWAKEDESNKSLALNGVVSMPAAMVDSTGLIGVALAFRAAAGELAMPDDGEERATKAKPWVVIDAEKPKKSDERVSVLEKQIELIEKELERARKDMEKRKLLAMDYKPKRRAAESKVEEDNAAVRGNPLWKKKKSLSVKTDNSMDGSSRGGEKSDIRVDADDLADPEGRSDDTTFTADNHQEKTAKAMVVDSLTE